MKTVFFCPDCGYVGAAEEDEAPFCPKCFTKLFRTGMDKETYTALSPEEKNAAASLWKYECSQPSEQTTEPGRNGVGTMLKAIGCIIYVIAAIAGLYLLTNRAQAAGWILLASGLISGTMFLGFGEIIRLLDVISKKN